MPPTARPCILAPLHTPRRKARRRAQRHRPGADVDDLAPGASDLVELYADQARLALDLLHEHHVLVEHLRLSDAAQSLLYDAVAQPDVPVPAGVVIGPRLAEMMRAGAVWTCAEVASGAHAEAASYPADVAGRLGADICTLVEPMVGDLLDRRHDPHRRGLARCSAGSPGSPTSSGRCSPRSAAARASAVRCWCSAATDDEPWTEQERDRARRPRPTTGLGGRAARDPAPRPASRRRAARARPVPPRPGRLPHPRPQDPADRDRAERGAARVRPPPGRGGRAPRGRDPTQRRAVVQPGGRPAGTGARRGGTRRRPG